MGLNKNCKGTKNLALQYWLQKELIVEQVQVAQAADLFRHGCSSSKKRPKSRKDPELCPVPVPETDRPRLSRSRSEKRFSLKQTDNRTNFFPSWLPTIASVSATSNVTMEIKPL